VSAKQPTGDVTIHPVRGIPEVAAGDDLADFIARHAGPIAAGDIVVVSSKVVSKAEGRVIPAAGGTGEAARSEAARSEAGRSEAGRSEAGRSEAGRSEAGRSEAGRSEAIRSETVRVVAARGPTQIVQTRHGFVMAAAGVDASNVPAGTVLLLPEDPDESARGLRRALSERFRVQLGVIVTDTFGRPWRLGQTDLAIGAAGVRVLDDHRGRTDAHGNELAVTAPAHADELAAAAELVKGKVAQVPVAVVRGLASLVTTEDGPGVRALVRPEDDDLFRLGSREAAREALRQTGRQDIADVPPDPVAVARAIEVAADAAASTTSMYGFVEVEDPAIRKSLLDALGLPSSAHALVAYLQRDLDAVALTPALLDLGGLRDRLALACRVEGLTSRWCPADDLGGVRAAIDALLPHADTEPAGLLTIGTPVRDHDELPPT
jgi:coenzyme F420-0:L-glutamate ligase / coenzyme F420-1:gamma-L-glutamate ligase